MYSCSGRPGFIAAVSIALALLGPLPTTEAANEQIAILKSADLSAYTQAVTGFVNASSGDHYNLREYNIHGDPEQGRKAARSIRANSTSLVLAVGVKAAIAARSEIHDIPVIYCLVLEPDRYDLSAPNLSGIALQIPVSQQLATMKTVLPRLKGLGVLHDPRKTGQIVKEAKAVGEQNGIKIVAQAVSTERDIPSALRTLLPQVDAVWLIPDTTVLSDESLPFILQESLEANRPVFGFSAEFTRQGALMSLSPSYTDIGRQAAGLAKRILEGQITPPLRKVPEQYTIAVNLKTARYLGITIPPEIERRIQERY